MMARDSFQGISRRGTSGYSEIMGEYGKRYPGSSNLWREQPPADDYYLPKRMRKGSKKKSKPKVGRKS